MAEQPIKPFEIKLEDFFTKVLSMIGKITDQQIADLLKASQQTIAVAESVTGGLISSRLTNPAGSSEYFVGSIVCYHPRIKALEVGVPASIISQYGIVSKEVAMALAEKIKEKFRTNIGLSSTGVAGPSPLPPAPVGKVFIALAGNKKTEFKELNLQGSRQEIREKAAQSALGLLWLELGGEEIINKGGKSR